MKELPLINSPLKALVDDADFEKCSRFRWRIYNDSGVGTDFTKEDGTNTTMFLHRLLMNVAIGDPREVDHRDRNNLNNTRRNLRIANDSEQAWNRGPHRDRMYCPYKGVTFHKKSKKWYAQIMKDGKNMCAGMFNDPESAALAYNIAAVKLFGEFAYVNKVLSAAGKG